MWSPSYFPHLTGAPRSLQGQLGLTFFFFLSVGCTYDVPVFERDQGGDTANCTDGIQNGSETGTDCGGTCSLCSFLNVWRLTDGTSRWIQVSPNETDGPRSPVLAAFDIESEDRAYLLTATHYHVMTLSAPLRFVEVGSLSSLFPELPLAPEAAYQVPSRGENDTSVTIITAERAYLYDYFLDHHTFTYDRMVAETWFGDNAPTYATANAMWLSLENDAMWTMCDAPEYVGVLSADRVHIQSLGACGGGFTEMPLARDFDPFTQADAPATTGAGALVYHERALWLFLN